MKNLFFKTKLFLFCYSWRQPRILWFNEFFPKWVTSICNAFFHNSFSLWLMTTSTLPSGTHCHHFFFVFIISRKAKMFWIHHFKNIQFTQNFWVLKFQCTQCGRVNYFERINDSFWIDYCKITTPFNSSNHSTFTSFVGSVRNLSTTITHILSHICTQILLNSSLWYSLHFVQIFIWIVWFKRSWN
jgi:hypothetical protein